MKPYQIRRITFTDRDHNHDRARPTHENNKGPFESAAVFLGLASSLPLFGLIYALGFFYSIDSTAFQMFSVTDLLKFSGTRAPFLITSVAATGLVGASFYGIQKSPDILIKMSPRKWTILVAVLLSIVAILLATIYYLRYLNYVGIHSQFSLFLATLALMVIANTLLISAIYRRARSKTPNGVMLFFWLPNFSSVYILTWL